MKELCLFLLMVLTIVIPVVVFFKSERKRVDFKRSLKFNTIGFFGLLLISTIIMFTGSVSAAGDGGLTTAQGLALLGSGIPTAGSAIGAGVATGHAAAAALGALSEDEKMFGKAMLFVAMAEGIALYGLLISFFIISKI